jgi:cell division transport system permease protein
MTKNKKPTAKAIKQQKRHRRQWITFLRMCRYGVNNFTRNAWLTVAATAVMTLTLLIIFVSVVARNVLIDTSNTISSNVQMSIYLRTDTPKESVDEIAGELRQLDSVTGVTVESPDQARQQIAEDNSSDLEYLEAIQEMNSQLPWTISVSTVDINDTEELSAYVAASETVLEYSSRPASFSGERRAAIDTIAGAVQFAQGLGLVVGAIFVFVSMLIIFNTIRMAIFNRRDEIQMMKLIGAERSFIRGPFLVEAMFYGFIAALLATVIGYAILYAVQPTLANNDISIQPTIDFLVTYVGFVLLAMIIIGAIIGIVSSMLATRRYLKIK